MDHIDSKSMQPGETPGHLAIFLKKERSKIKMDTKKRYYRKNVELFILLNKMKLWPARSGGLHGIKDIEINGRYATITTHCGEKIQISNSRNSRSARWLRNKWASVPCPKCKVPEWKLEKYSKTFFSQYGSDLQHKDEK